MVFKTIANLSKFTKPANYHHPFFDPSYVKQSNLTVVDGIINREAHINSGRCEANPHPSNAATSKYVVFDNTDRKESCKGVSHQRILVKKASHKVNRNGHVSLSLSPIDCATSNLRVRRTNSHVCKNFVIEKRLLHTSSQPPQTKEYYEPCENEDFKELPFLTLQQNTINNLIATGRSNEVLAVYLRIRALDHVPPLKMYNQVLKSVVLRSNTMESIEDKLTHLLNIYSDILSNNVKPDQQTYSLVIGTLLNGALRSHANQNSQLGNDFFKIALELFLVTNSKNIHLPKFVYENLLACLVVFHTAGNIQIEFLENIMSSHLQKDSPIYYIGLIQFGKLKKDSSFILDMYKHFRRSCAMHKYLSLHQFPVYCHVIDSLIYCNELPTATKLLDECLLSIRDVSGMHSHMSDLISSYLSGLASVGRLDEAYKVLLEFDAIPWLPDVSVSSLLNLVEKSCDEQNEDLAVKFWNFAVIRKDFDTPIALKTSTDISQGLSNDVLMVLMVSLNASSQKAFSKLISLELSEQNRSMVVRLSRELLIKKSLSLDLPVLMNLLNYFFNSSRNVPTNFLIELLASAGAKSSLGAHQYLSTVVDFIPEKLVVDLAETGFFKKCVESFRLLTDSLYGIEKGVKALDAIDDEKLQKKCSYYKNVLKYELNDVANHYVDVPPEVEEFRQYINA